MSADQPEDTDVQGQINDLRARVDEADQRADASESRADKAELRADDSATRADTADDRTNAGDARAHDDRRRLADVEGRLDVHEEMIAELQAEGLLSSEQAAELKVALETATTIGAAVGTIMTICKVSEDVAFRLLRKESMHSNRKLHLVAEDIVSKGYTYGLPPR
ncbi:ANTAR domain-containing protein [Knoellia sp. S7-12]|uniref:ANTAR domain-containing protein n=1 Tax=Knoellia sp. S7-12 TaxID=3126698 RepID=UPI0033672721